MAIPQKQKKKISHLKPTKQSLNSSSSSLKATVKDQSGQGKKRIGEILCKEGHITSSQLQDALNIQKKTKGRLSSILLKQGYIEDETIVNVLSRIHNYPAATPRSFNPPPDLLQFVPYDMAKKHLAFPLGKRERTLDVAMTEPTDTDAVEALQTDVRMNIKVHVASEKAIIDAYKKFYKISEEEYDSYFAKDEDQQDDMPITQVDDFGSLVSEAVGDMEIEAAAEEMIKDEFSAGDAPIIKLVNGILSKAVADGVSDIHVEPFEHSLQVRYRIDGTLYKSMNLPLTIKNGLISRIKILSNLDISERRVPQDGRIKMRMGKNTAVDFRVSTLPTLFGESVVMRILDKGALNVDLTKLGFEQETFDALKRCIYQPYGLLLVTGPTGSGKTTTLYSVLNVLNNEETKILTAEDPVEFNFKGINQVNVRNDVGMTFAAALKAFLRQDPEIIMVGEIRDMETAEIAIKAAMTGHLVFSTLHTNDCPSTIGRLRDIGIPSYMLASSVSMVLSQRLARRLCPKCKVLETHHSPNDLELMGFSKDEIPELQLYGPKGCPDCNNGYRGRVGLYELMEVTDEVSQAINADIPEDQLRKVASNEGMKTLREAGLQKIREGQTSVEEVLKRTIITKEAMPAYMVNPDIERYEDGDIIIHEGNQDIDFFKLVQGQLIVSKQGKKIAEITEPGDYFGEMAAILGEERSASIISKGRSVIKRFPGDKLPEIIEKYPDVAKHLFEVIAQRLGHANKITIRLANDIGRKK
jgi:type IV pilus assembly protein PilB